MRRWFHALALVIGAIGLALVVRELGWEGMRRVIVGTGAWFAVVAAIDVASLSCDAGGVYSFLRPQAPISYGRVLVAQASGLAINRLTPGNSMGEPVKVTLLVEHVPAEAAVSAIVMFNLATILVAVAVIVVGAPITLLLLDLPARLAIAVGVATGILVALSVALVLLSRRGAIGSLVGALRSVRIISSERAAAWRARVAPIDARVRELGAPGMRRGFGFVIGSRVLHAAGTLVVMYAAGAPMTGALAMATVSIGILITWISNVIPLGLGIADTSNYALYSIVGSTGPIGLVFTMVNRMRTVLLALIGLSIMALATGSSGSGRRPPTP